MNTLYPLKFKPIFKDKIWGGQKISSKLGIDFGDLPNCGEVWVISGVDGNPTLVENGFLAGNELNELVEVYMGDLVGDQLFDRFGNEFPLLIKFIDANDWLSIQVHPDDNLAIQRQIGQGKTEMWYILDADKDAKLISGFRNSYDKDSFKQCLEKQCIEEALNWENVKEGEVYYIPAGRIHALGPGLLLAEIQQTSDTTYRIHDWNRVDAEGNTRDLHLEEAMDAIDFELAKDYKTAYELIANKTSEIIDKPHFTTNMVSLEGVVEKDYESLDSFVIYVNVEGACSVIWDEGDLTLKLGEALLVPASVSHLVFHPIVASKLLEVYIK